MFGTTSRFRIGHIGGHEIAIDPIPLGIFALFLFSWDDRSFAAAFFVSTCLSILIHELGHAFTIQGLLGQDAVVVVFGFGGVTFPKESDPRSLAYVTDRRRPRTPGQQILISLAGPGAGFVLGGVCWLVASSSIPDFRVPFDFHFVAGATFWVYAAQIMVAVSLVWGALNLVPAYPLDGGQAFRATLRKFGLSADRAGRWARRLGLVLWAAAAVAGYLYGRNTILVFFAAWFFLMNFTESRRLGF